MLNRTITINDDTGIAYICDAIRQAGFKGKVFYLENPLAIVLVKPGTCLEDLKTSLENIVADIELEMKAGGENDRTEPGSDSLERTAGVES